MSVADLRHTLAELAGVPEPAIRAACKAVEQIAAQEGGSITVVRFNGRNAKQTTYKLKAKTRIKVTGDVASATVWGTPTGFWVWKNTGTAPHTIGPRRKDTKTKRRAIKLPGSTHPVRVVDHPGTRGRGAWRKVIRRAERVVPQIVANHVHRAVTRG